jgi:outer membrane protein OmpU
LSVDYAIGATTVTAFYADHGTDMTAYGRGASYDLGGGASLKGGLAKLEDTDTVADFGLSFSF